jgi:hypothetical protein
VELARKGADEGVRFYRQRRWTLPGQEPIPEITPQKMARAVDKGRPAELSRLSAQPSDSQRRLPLRSAEDLQELAALYSPAADDADMAVLPHASLGRDLQFLARHGWHFYADRCEVGLYGAYNALTDPAHGLGRPRAWHGGLEVAIPLADAAAVADLASFYRDPAARSQAAAALAMLEDRGYRLFDKQKEATCAFRAWQAPEQGWVGARRDPWLPASTLDLAHPEEALQTLQAFDRLQRLCGGSERGRRAWELLHRPASGLDFEAKEAHLAALARLEDGGSEALETYRMLLEGLRPGQAFPQAVEAYSAFRQALGEAPAAQARQVWARFRQEGLGPEEVLAEAASLKPWLADRATAPKALEIWELVRQDTLDTRPEREETLRRLLAAEKGSQNPLQDALDVFGSLLRLRRPEEPVARLADLYLEALQTAGVKNTPQALRAFEMVHRELPGLTPDAAREHLAQAGRLVASLSQPDWAEPVWDLVKVPLGGESLAQRVDAFLTLQTSERGGNATADALRDYGTLAEGLLPGQDLSRTLPLLTNLLKLAGEPDQESTASALTVLARLRQGASSEAELARRCELFTAWARAGQGFLAAAYTLEALAQVRPDSNLTERMQLLTELLKLEKNSDAPLSDALAAFRLLLAPGAPASRPAQAVSLLKSWGVWETKAVLGALETLERRAAGDAAYLDDLVTMAVLGGRPAELPAMLARLDALPEEQRPAAAGAYRALLAAEAAMQGGCDSAAQDLELALELAGTMGDVRVAGLALARLVANIGGARGRAVLRKLAGEWSQDTLRNQGLVALAEAGVDEPAALWDGLADAAEKKALLTLLEARRGRYPWYGEADQDLEVVRSTRAAGEDLEAAAQRLGELISSLAAHKLRADARELYTWLRQELAAGRLGQGVGIDHAHRALVSQLLLGRSPEEARQALLEGAARRIVEEEEQVQVGGVVLPRRPG